jgi:hypothetical protein
MTERRYEDAVQVLKRYLGSRWDGLETEGRSEMAKILQRELGFDAGAANDAVGEMINSGQLRYHRAEAADDSTAVPSERANIVTTAPNATGTPGLPGAGFASGQGYWEIGAGDEGGWEGPLVKSTQADTNSR